MKKTVQDKLSNFIGSTIVSYSFDLLTNTLVLELELLRDDVLTKHKVEFLKVATGYYINDFGDSRKEMVAWDYLELTDIALLERPINIDASLSDLAESDPVYQGGGNCVLEIWDKAVVIETPEVRVDGESFVIGDW